MDVRGYLFLLWNDRVGFARDEQYGVSCIEMLLKRTVLILDVGRRLESNILRFPLF